MMVDKERTEGTGNKNTEENNKIINRTATTVTAGTPLAGWHHDGPPPEGPGFTRGLVVLTFLEWKVSNRIESMPVARRRHAGPGPGPASRRRESEHSQF